MVGKNKNFFDDEKAREVRAVLLFGTAILVRGEGGEPLFATGVAVG